MSAAQVPPPSDPWCSAGVTLITRPADGWGPERPAIRCEVRGDPDVGGVYYWTPREARAIARALAQAGYLAPAQTPAPEAA